VPFFRLRHPPTAAPPPGKPPRALVRADVAELKAYSYRKARFKNRRGAVDMSDDQNKNRTSTNIPNAAGAASPR